MNLIYYRGLDCYTACVINIAVSLGVNVQDAFCTLWSETDFFYDTKYHTYSSKRLLHNLEALGASIEVLHGASHQETEESFSLVPEGERFIVGMDTFHIPWNLVYQHFHEPHYFFAQKVKPGTISCFDPTYNLVDMPLPSGDIALHSFHLSRIRKRPVTPLRLDITQEARDILRKHPETQEQFLVEMNQCKAKEQKNITPLVKRMSAMINNRYLFQRFLCQYPFTFAHGRQFFDNAFFAKWEAVKNGVYKAYILKHNESVVDEVCRLFLDLMREETDMAKKMITLISNERTI